MKSLINVWLILVIAAAAAAIQADFVNAQVGRMVQPHKKFTGFFSVSAGRFNLKFPDTAPGLEQTGIEVGFEDLYGSKSGLSYGGEFGFGHGRSRLFWVLRYRVWKKTNGPLQLQQVSLDGKTNWSQNFLTIGPRYFFLGLARPKSRIVPFLGGGIVYSIATASIIGEITGLGAPENVDLSLRLDGTSFYGECGIDVFLTRSLSLRGFVEFSELDLNLSKVKFSDREIPVLGAQNIDGGGGLFIGVSASAFFGRPLTRE